MLARADLEGPVVWWGGAFMSLSMSSSEVADWSQIIIIPAGQCLPAIWLTEIQSL